ncbi:MAG: hypothetical protein HUK15_03725, partial [Bacteroidales bacterium]|nr:hypothetical protein [Bacteroidales bacterium]
KAQYNDNSSTISANIQPIDIKAVGDIDQGKYSAKTNFSQIVANINDSTSNSKFVIDTINFTADANISDTEYGVYSKLDLNINEINNSGVKFKNIPLNMEVKAQADSSFSKINVDTLQISCTNNINIEASGKIANQTDSIWDTDIALKLDVPHIDNVMKMIPANLIADLKNYKVSGAINFNGTAKGKYDGNTYPNIKADIALSNIKAYVVDQDAEVNLNLISDIFYNSTNETSSYINISEFDASIGQAYINLTGKAQNILKNPAIDAKLKCNLDLDYISKIFPIEDITYRGKLSSDIEAKFTLNDLMKANFPKIYMLGNINIDKILLRIPSQRFFVFSKNTTADLGINSISGKRSGKTHLSSAKISLDTLSITSHKKINATISKLSLSASVDEPQNEIPQMRVSGRINGLQAIVADTMFVEGKSGRISMSIKPDSTDSLIPSLKATLNLDSINYYEPTLGAFLDSTRIVLNGRPRTRKFKMVNGERVAIDQSTRKPVSIDSLINLCNSVNDAEAVLKKFTFDGKIYAKAARVMSPYFDLRTAARKLDVTFTDDTLSLNNFTMRVGKSRLKVNGKVENIRRALLRGKVLSADLTISSRNLDLNEILYANYIGGQNKAKDDIIRSIALNKDTQAPQNQHYNPQKANHISGDSISRAHFMDSLKRSYTNKDLSSIYKERMSGIKKLVDEAYLEELLISDADDEETESEEVDLDTVPMTLIKVPGNLSANINLRLDTIRFAGLKMNDFSGSISTKNHTLSIKDLKTNSNIGDLRLNATYQCENLDSAKAGIDMIGTNVTVENLLTALPMLDSIFPMLSSFEGKLDCELSAFTNLNSEMEPVLPTLQTACHINGKDLVLLDGETFSTIAKYLLFKKKTKNVIDKMSLEFTIDNNILSVYPFTISMDKYKVAVSGKMDFDFKYFFHISVLEPKGLPIPLGINVQTKEAKVKKSKNKKNDLAEGAEEGELVESDDDFEYRLVKPLYKDEKSIAQSINLVNKSGVGRITLQQTLRKTIQDIIDNYGTEGKKER